MAKAYQIVIIFLFVVIFLPSLASAATLSISPASGTYEVGERVVVKVLVSSSDVQFNAVSGALSFPPSIFQIESVSKASSVLNFWVSEPAFSKTANTVKFEGISLGGFQGFSGTVVTVALRAINPGSGNIAFQSGQVLANDGQGTDITGNLSGGNFTVKEGTIKPLPPKQESPTVPVVEPERESEPEIIQPKPTLEAPEIMLGKNYGVESIQGRSDYAKAQTLVTFTAVDGVKVFIIGTADEKGAFSTLIPNSLKHGSYTVSAVMIKEDKTNSEASNTLVVTVGHIFSDISWQIWIVIVFLILSIIYLLVRSYDHFGKERNRINKLKNEVKDAENVIHKSFDLLREDVIDYDNQKLSNSEHKRMSSIKKDIMDAEKIITKEIKDIK